ncbi:41604_t:CDS:1, partial [Gigaspora margarita]
ERSAWLGQCKTLAEPSRAVCITNQGGQINKTAQIIWVGYDATSSVFPPPSLDQAVIAAPALVLFQQGLVTTHQGMPPHITVVGHSYGTDIVTETTINGNMLVANDILFIGSPGVPVDRASEITKNMISSNSGQHDPPTESGQLRQAKTPLLL